MTLLPVALDVRERPCLVVGGGGVAARKVAALLECEARVTLIAPVVNDEMRTLLPRLEYFERSFEAGDCAGYALIFACTDNRDTNAAIATEARLATLWHNVADDAAAGDFHGAAAVRRGEICIGITTGGGSPALARHLKERIESCVGPEYATLLEMLEARREVLKARVDDQNQRATIWRSVLESDALDLLRQGQRAKAERRVDGLLNELRDDLP